jgi:HKD family nuclease
MSLKKIEFLYENPLQMIAGKIRNLIEISQNIKIIAGFLTDNGLDLIFSPIKKDPKKLSLLLIGSANQNAFDAIDRLISIRVDKSKILVDLGHTRLSNSGFVKYHPMMHSKIYFFEIDSKTSAAIIGSHNMTSFALGGLNSEAAIYIEGDKTNPLFQDILSHINKCASEAVPYDPTMQEIYAEYFRMYMERLATFIFYKGEKVNYKDRTFIIIAQLDSSLARLSAGDKIFFRAPDIIKFLSKLDIDVHIYIFDKLPKNPLEALKNLHSPKEKYKGTVSGTNKNDSLDTANVNLVIDDLKNPIISKKPTPYNFSSGVNEFQIIVDINSILEKEFEYKFTAEIDKIIPELNENKSIDYQLNNSVMNVDDTEQIEDLNNWVQNLPNWIQGPWYKVKGLKIETKSREELRYIELSPYGDNFILYSYARNQIISEESRAYCIRCKDFIEYNSSRPLCIKCFKIWAKFGKNSNYPEKYCHRCGTSYKTTIKTPFCNDCEKL